MIVFCNKSDNGIDSNMTLYILRCSSLDSCIKIFVDSRSYSYFDTYIDFEEFVYDSICE